MDRIERRKNLYGLEVRELDQRRTSTKYSPEIKQLWQRSHEILGLALQGYTNVQIAKALNVTPACITNTINSELGEKKLASMRKERDGEFIDVSRKIKELSEKALKVYEEIFDSDTISYNLKKSTSDTVLMDLGGHRAPTKIDSRSVSLTASVEELEEFKQLGYKAAKEAGFLIDLPEEHTADVN